MIHHISQPPSYLSTSITLISSYLHTCTFIIPPCLHHASPSSYHHHTSHFYYTARPSSYLYTLIILSHYHTSLQFLYFHYTSSSSLYFSTIIIPQPTIVTLILKHIWDRTTPCTAGVPTLTEKKKRYVSRILSFLGTDFDILVISSFQGRVEVRLMPDATPYCLHLPPFCSIIFPSRPPCVLSTLPSITSLHPNPPNHKTNTWYQYHCY